MSAADYYNDPRYRPPAHQYPPQYPQHPPPQYEPRPSRHQQHMGLSRMDAHEDSPIEEIPREFPPGEYPHGYRPKRSSRRNRDPPRRARSAYGRYDDGYYDGDRRGHRSDRYRSDRHRPSKYDDPRRDHRPPRSYSSSPSPPPPRRKPKRRKSLTEQAMGAMGALGLGNALTGKHDDSTRRRHRSDSRGETRRRRRRGYDSDSSSPSPSRDGRVRGPGGLDQAQIAQAVKAALTAGAAEAYRARKEPGGWTGEKGKRIITAALASGGADGVIDKDPNKHGKRHIIESALAGLATNRAVNGPRSRDGSRDRGHSSRHGAAKGIATTGALAAAGKEIYDHLKSRSESRGRGRSDSDSDDGRGDRPRRKKRSKSVSDYISKGLAAVGLNDPDDRYGDKPKRRGDRRRRYDDDYDSDSSYDSEADFRPRRRGHGGGDGNSREVGRFLQEPSPTGPDPNTALSKYQGGGSVGRYHPPQHNAHSDNDSDLGSSSGEERTRKKMNRHQLLTTGMATLASVHAAHSVVGSMKKRKARLAAVRSGDLDPEDARRMRKKNNMKDVASLGFAGLGVYSAVDEWLDAKKTRAECKQFEEAAKERAMKRRSIRSKSLDSGAIQRWRESSSPPYD